MYVVLPVYITSTEYERKTKSVYLIKAFEMLSRIYILYICNEVQYELKKFST